MTNELYSSAAPPRSDQSQPSQQKNGTMHNFARLCTSQHVKDLRWIAILVIVGFVLGLLCVYYEQQYLHVGDAMSLFTITLGGVVAGAGATLNWAYQTGSNRLGMVDLFACEINVICRVCLIVDFARRSVDQAKNKSADSAGASAAASGQPQPPPRFTTQEDYTPVYDQNLSELQPLEAQVVTHVTEFYTYRKTMLDMLRRIAVQSDDPLGREQSTVGMIYMQYLMYESGRLAIEDLIEFEPNRTESVIGILCSELIVYKFLVDEFSQDKYRIGADGEDFRLQRLNLRRSNYEKEVQAIFAKTLAAHSVKWRKAQATAVELKERFNQVFRIELSEPKAS
jgi:hypothetical protein